MSALAKAWFALCALLLLAPLALSPTQAQYVGADAGLPLLPDMSTRPTASLAR
jgi:hypothetical protein